MAEQSSGGGGSFAAFKRKYGPLPLWGWMALILGAALAYELYKSHESSKSAAGSDTSGSGDEVPADQVPDVIIQNDGATGPPGPPGPPGPKGKTPPPVKGTTRAITVTKNQTLAQLAKYYHWDPKTLAAVEKMNKTQGGGTLTPSSKLTKGQVIIRPLG
jgi:hypothetical protein